MERKILNRNIKIDLHIQSEASAYKEAHGQVDENKIENNEEKIKIDFKNGITFIINNLET